MERKIKAPIILVGSPRSGTTLLGRLFAAHPDVAYWEEPRTIWSIGNAYRGDDVLDERHCTSAITRQIDRRFGEFLARSGRTRFAEKTPSNMLRLRFIHSLYPDCRIVHIYRDGRSVVMSSLRMLEAPPQAHRVWARVRETPLRSWPALLPLFARDVVQRRLRGRKTFWGPRPPGWKDWTDLPAATMMARQWRVLLERAEADLQVLPPESWIQLRYEDLLARPDRHLPDVIDFAGLRRSTDVTALAAQVLNPGRLDAWQVEAAPAVVRQIEQEAGPLLSRLGYSLRGID